MGLFLHTYVNQRIFGVQSGMLPFTIAENIRSFYTGILLIQFFGAGLLHTVVLYIRLPDQGLFTTGS